MKPQTEKTDGAAGSPRENITMSRFVASAVVIAASAAVFALWFFFLSPQARIKSEVKKLISSIEKLDTAATMQCFSDDYYDNSGLDKAGLARIAEMSFDYFDKIKVIPKRKTTFADGRSGGASISGTAIVFTGDSPMKIDFVSEPVRLDFRKEKDGWKIISISGFDRAVIDEIESYLR
ncbi:MAG: hypothetical protein BWY28_00399 [bacterium ADurb.Bin236]|nr:MAG: hypothetical protein BWY28_00399 [bacterium ADurb.Bin236]HOY61610.1 hypothetical protein [bacterium]